MSSLSSDELNALNGLLFYLNKNVSSHQHLDLVINVKSEDVPVPVCIRRDSIEEGQYVLAFLG